MPPLAENKVLHVTIGFLILLGGGVWKMSQYVSQLDELEVRVVKIESTDNSAYWTALRNAKEESHEHAEEIRTDILSIEARFQKELDFHHHHGK